MTAIVIFVKIVKNTLSCYCCKDYFIDEDQAATDGYDGYYVCEHCYDKNVVHCDDCGELTVKDPRRRYPDDKIICLNCFNKYFYCDICNKIEKMEACTIFADLGLMVCPSCMKESVKDCNRCGKKIAIGNRLLLENRSYVIDEKYYCEECVTNCLKYDMICVIGNDCTRCHHEAKIV